MPFSPLLTGLGSGLGGLASGLQFGLQRADRLAQIEQQNALKKQMIEGDANRAAINSMIAQERDRKTAEDRGKRLKLEEDRIGVAKEGVGVQRQRAENAKERIGIARQKEDRLEKTGGLSADTKARLEMEAARLSLQERTAKIAEFRARLAPKYARLNQLTKTVAAAAADYQEADPNMIQEINDTKADIFRLEALIETMGGGGQQRAPAPRVRPRGASPAPPAQTPITDPIEDLMKRNKLGLPGG